MENKKISQLDPYSGNPDSFDIPGVADGQTLKTNLGAAIQKKITSERLLRSSDLKTVNGVPLTGQGDIALGLVHPFKGWYDSLEELQTAVASPKVGDYAYIKSANVGDPAAIYECVTAGTWSDSGRTVDTSNVQTFKTGQTVNEVRIINDLETGGVDNVLSAEQGKVIGKLKTEVEGGIKIEYEILELSSGYYHTYHSTMPTEITPSTTGTYCYKIGVTEGDKFVIKGKGGNAYALLFCIYNSNGEKVRSSQLNENHRDTPLTVTIEDGESFLVVNLAQYDPSTDSLKKEVDIVIDGLINDIEDVRERQTSQETSFEKIEGEFNSLAENDLTSISNTPLSNTVYESAISSFSGWGMPLCENAKIQKVKINVYNRDSSNLTQVLFIIRKDSKDGEIIAQKLVDTNIAPDASEDVICEFDSEVYYDGLIYFQYACDKLITRLGWADASNYPYKKSLGYPACSYKSSGIISTSFNATTADESAFWVEYYFTEVVLKDTQIENIKSRLHIEPAVQQVDIDIPDTIYAIVDDPLQLYYKSIFRCVNPYVYDIKVTCDIGAQYPRYYEVTPESSQIGNHNIVFTIKDNNDNILGTKSAILKVVTKVNNPGAKNILCVGASNTSGGNWPGELKKRLTTESGTPTVSGEQTMFTPIGFSIPNLNFVGRKIKNGVNFEATGGYNFNTYITASAVYVRFFFTRENVPTVSIGDTYTDGTTVFTVAEINVPDLNELQGYYGNINFSVDTLPASAGLTLTRVSGNGDATLTASASSMSGNPFVYNGEINIEQYADDYCGGQIDIIYTELFGNGLVRQYQTDFTDTFAKMQSFIDMFLAVFPNCKFCINIMQNKDEKGGLGENYGAGTSPYAYPYGLKYGCHNLLTELQKYINDNNLVNTVFIVNTLNEFDCENDYRKTAKQVNPRSGATEIFGVNGAHPSEIGYFQMADAAVRAFIAHFCQ